MKFKRISNIFLAVGFLFLSYSCVDDKLDPNEGWNNNLPEEFKEEYSLTFQISLDPLGGEEFRTRDSDDGIRDIEDYVDLESLRILFFTCQDEGKSDGTYNESGKTYDSGRYDVFMFESKSRWVSEVESSATSASKVWQVTTPVFTYGNDKVYDWERIRTALTTKNFKIAILANRPGEIRFGDYDGVFKNDGRDYFSFHNQGPYWGPDQSFDEKVTINDLHHCQWDPVYTSKNLIMGVSSTGNNTDLTKANGNNVYDIIMKNPAQKTLPEVVNGDTVNQMGVITTWVEEDKATGDKYYILPTRERGGIPMYGIQKFEPIANWTPGTPFNISQNQKGQDNSYYGKTISLLRSLVRLDLYIPKELGGKKTTITGPVLIGSNVMGRTEPLDVATPTNLLWSNDFCNESNHGKDGVQQCEWFLIQKHGPIITDPAGATAAKGQIDGNNQAMVKCRTDFWAKDAWYYGAWRSWWNFNNINLDFGNGPYPHIFNPCTQRNTTVRLERVKVDDPAYHHYVVYTGERNINDPTNFRDLRVEESKICYFKFGINYEDATSSTSKVYCIAITDYSSNSIITASNKDYMKSGANLDDKNGYLNDMAISKNPNDWNWVLMRNHAYRFFVQGIAGNLDDGGFDGLVISTEQRAAPTITYD